MIEKEQIAHDLAVAKLSGSNLGTKELIETYQKHKDEILSVLNEEPAKRRTAVIGNPPPQFR